MDCSHLVAQDRDCICSFSKSSSFHVFITSVTLFINCSDRRCLHRWKTCFFFFIGIYTGNMQSWSVPRLGESCDISKNFKKKTMKIDEFLWSHFSTEDGREKSKISGTFCFITSRKVKTQLKCKTRLCV